MDYGMLSYKSQFKISLVNENYKWGRTGSSVATFCGNCKAVLSGKFLNWCGDVATCHYPVLLGLPWACVTPLPYIMIGQNLGTIP